MEMKYLLVFVVLAVVVGNWNIIANPQVDFTKNATVIVINDNPHNHASDDEHLREARFAKPYYGFIGIWNTLGNIRYIFTGQKNETSGALQKILNILQDGFSDTATKKPYQTQYNVKEYKDEAGIALSRYTVPKVVSSSKTTTVSETKN